MLSEPDAEDMEDNITCGRNQQGPLPVVTFGSGLSSAFGPRYCGRLYHSNPRLLTSISRVYVSGHSHNSDSFLTQAVVRIQKPFFLNGH